MINNMKRCKLGSLIEVRRGQSLSGNFYANKGEHVRLTLANFDYVNGGFKSDSQKDDIFYNGPVKPECLLKAGDIITPLTEQALGLLGSTARIPESNKYIQSGDIGLVTCKEGLIDPQFCYYLLPSKQVKKQLAAGSQQTKIRHTSPDAIEACVVDIPEFEQQKRIGDFLSLLDSKINLNRSINNTFESLAKILYEYWFVQFDFPDEKGKPYKSNGGEMIWNEKLKREIPHNWECTTLGEICEMYQPQTIGGNLLKPNGQYRVYGANGIVGRYDEYNHENSEIAMSCRGYCGIVNRTMPKSWITGNAMVIKLKNENYCNEYIKQALAYMNISGAITGSVQKQITRENLSKVLCIKPDDKLIKAFSKIVFPIVEGQIKITIEIEDLMKQREELLPLLMNGQISLTTDL